jgi:outer membrane protein assembly factor BamE
MTALSPLYGLNDTRRRIWTTVACWALSASLLSLGGCVYKVNLSQGNYLEAKTVEQVKEGMTRAQVRFLLGTPQVGDNFHPERWDYMYYYKVGKTQEVDRQWFVVHFENDKVIRIEKKTGEFKDPKTLPIPGI